MIYFWDPTTPHWEEGAMAERAGGYYFDMLQVEQTNEGWHGMVFLTIVDEDDEGYYGHIELIDEQVFSFREEAVMWCEVLDETRAKADTSWKMDVEVYE